MTRLTQRQRLLGGALVVSAAAWCVHALLGTSGPSDALAQPTPPAAVGVPRWQDPGETVERLTRRQYRSVTRELEQLSRDLFQPTPLIEAALAPQEAQPSKEAPPPEDEIDPALAFQANHQLNGVMLGSRPLAVVGDSVLSINSELDGFRLIAIRREMVVFLDPRSGAQVALKLQHGPERSPRAPSE